MRSRSTAQPERSNAWFASPEPNTSSLKPQPKFNLDSMRQKLKALAAEYGKVAVFVWFGIFVLVFAAAAIAIHFGFEFEGAAGSAGTLGAAYIATKLTQPLRILATVALTPLVAKVVRRRPAESPADDQAPPA
jgi:hypothetical protein